MIYTLQYKVKLTHIINKLWIFIWVIMSISAPIAVLTYKIMPDYFVFNLDKPYLAISDIYDYNNASIFGNVLEKRIYIMSNYTIIPRFCGWFTEPGYISFYFGLNVCIAKTLISNNIKRNTFIFINMIGGLLTFSVTYYLFIFMYYGYKLFILIIPNIKVYYGLIITITIVLSSTIYNYLINPEMLTNTSLADRVRRHSGSIDLLSELSTTNLIFGFGIENFKNVLVAGSTSSFWDILIGKGIIIFCIVFYLFFKYNYYNGVMIIFIIFYNLFFPTFTQPIFFLGLAIPYAMYYQKEIHRLK